MSFKTMFIDFTEKPEILYLMSFYPNFSLPISLYGVEAIIFSHFLFIYIYFYFLFGDKHEEGIQSSKSTSVCNYYLIYSFRKDERPSRYQWNLNLQGKYRGMSPKNYARVLDFLAADLLKGEFVYNSICLHFKIC